MVGGERMFAKIKCVQKNSYLKLIKMDMKKLYLFGLLSLFSYIISGQSLSGEGYTANDLKESAALAYHKLKEIKPNQTSKWYSQQWMTHIVGDGFEKAVLTSVGLKRNKRLFGGTRPDAILKTAYLYDFEYVSFEAGIIVDAKAAIGGVVKYHKDRNPTQIPKYMDYLSSIPNLVKHGIAGLLFIVPHGTVIEDEIVHQANERNIRLYRAETYYSKELDYIYVGDVQWLNKQHIYSRDPTPIIDVQFDPINWRLRSKHVLITQYFEKRLEVYK